MRCALACGFLFLISPAFGQKAVFSVGSFAEFDGRSWGGVVLGQTTDGDMKRAFQTDKARFRPEAIALKTNQPETEVEVLLNGRGDKAKASGVLVRFQGGIPVAGLEDELGPMARRYYADRWEDWAIGTFAGKPVVAEFDAASNRVLSVILYRADRDPRWLASGTEPTPIVPVPDPGKDWDQIARFDVVRVTLDISRQNRPQDLTTRTLDRFEDDLIGDAELARGRGTIRYDRRNGSGSYEVRVNSGAFDKKLKASFNVTATLRVDTPYGTVTSTRYRSDSFDNDHIRRARRVVQATMDDLDTEIAQKIRALGPPPADVQRKTAWRNLATELAPF